MDLTNLPAQIIAVVDELDRATHDYGTAARNAAVAEAKWKSAHASEIVRLSEQQLTMKQTAAQRDAYALLRTRDEHATFLLCQANAEVCRQAIYSLRARLDALRTLNANVRVLTDPRTPY
jgi:hypothetical protein